MDEETFTVFEHATLRQRQLNIIAQGALTNSKRPSCFVDGVYPTHLESSKGCFVWDDKGKRYIDFICGLGTNLLGGANEWVNQAIQKQLEKGISFSLSTELEVKLAEKLSIIFPFTEKYKFLKTGSEACSAAIKIARAKTGRDLILSSDYHGWSDDFVYLTPPALGVPKAERHASILSLNDHRDALNHAAAVIIEPVNLDWSPERIEWLKKLKADCAYYGALLIFDEIITGFRFPGFSASKFTGVSPDLICLGKAIANGMPLAAVGGKKEVMECGEYFVSSTYAGETLSLAASLEVIHQLTQKLDLKYLWDKGEEFRRRFNAFYPEKLKIDGYGTRGVFSGDLQTKALFWQEAVKSGILFGSSWFFNFAHIDQMETVLSSCQDILVRIKTGSVELEGKLPESPFAQRMRENGKLAREN